MYFATLCTPPCALTPEQGQCLALPKLATCLQGQPEYLCASQLAKRRSWGRPRSDLNESETRTAGIARGGGGAMALVSCRLEQSGACRHRMDFSLCLATLAMTARTGEVEVSAFFYMCTLVVGHDDVRSNPHPKWVIAA